MVQQMFPAKGGWLDMDVIHGVQGHPFRKRVSQRMLAGICTTKKYQGAYSTYLLKVDINICL